MMSHDGFVLWSYGTAFVIFAVLMGWLMWDNRSTKSQLALLERAGAKRRSSTSGDKG